MFKRIVPSNENLQQGQQGRVTSLGYRSNEVHFVAQRAAVPEAFAALLQDVRIDAGLQLRWEAASCLDKQVKDAHISLTAAKKKNTGNACKYVLVAVKI